MSTIPAIRPEEFLTSLGILRAALSTALNRVQKGSDAFVYATEEHLRRFDESVTDIRVATQQLEKQFNRIEYLLAVRNARDSGLRIS